MNIPRLILTSYDTSKQNIISLVYKWLYPSKTTFQTYITCANLAVFAQQKIHLCKFRIFCTTNTISYNIDNFYLLMYHRYRLNRGVLHKADREIPWYIVSRYFSFAPEIITPSNHKK